MDEAASGSATGRSILVVDDDEAILQLAAACIERALGREYRVLLARTGEEALATVGRERPDLILLDIILPGIDGFEVCRRLKDSRTTSGIPIIFLTGRIEQADVEEGLSLGGDGYVMKPFNAVTLAAQIAELLPSGGKQAG